MKRRTVVTVGVAASAAAVAVCTVASPVATSVGQWGVPAIGTGFLVGLWLLAVAIRAARQHSRLAAELLQRAWPAPMDGMDVYLLDGLDGALVAGLRRPRIFCGRDLASRLTRDERRAVLLHEQYHQLDHAPAKLIALQALEPLVGRMEAGRAWLARRLAAFEIAADRHALDHGTSRAVLASALLKLSPLPHATVVGIGFTSATDLRLAALIDGTPPRVATVSARWLLVPAALAAVCVPLILAA